MIIRGGTVSTPIKPERNLVKATNLNEEEKAQARDNIGAASKDVETSVVQLKADLYNLQKITVIPNGDFLAGLIYTDGSVLQSDTHKCTDYIDISVYQNTAIQVKCTIYSSLCLGLYDKDKQPIGNINKNNAADYGITPSYKPQDIRFIVPNDVCYMRFSVHGSYFEDIQFYYITMNYSPVERMADTIDNLLVVEKNLTEKTNAIETAKAEFSDDDFVEGLLVSSGKVENHTSYKTSQFVYLPFIVNAKIAITCTIGGATALCFYNNKKEVISYIDSAAITAMGYVASVYTVQEFIVPVPVDAEYVRFCVRKDGIKSPLYICTMDVMSACREIDKNLKAVEESVEAELQSFDRRLSNFDMTKEYITSAGLSKVLVIGDSISADAYQKYPKWVTKLCEAGFFRADLVTNSSEHATGFVATYNNTYPSFITRLEAIEKPESYDLVIVFGGINDYIQEIPMGSFGSESLYKTHFKPALEHFFGYLAENFVNARFCVITPLHTSSESATSDGNKMEDYSKAIQDIALRYNLPVLDLTNYGGFYPHRSVTFKDRWTLKLESWEHGDGVHPNEEFCAKFLAPQIRNFVRGLI